jgi:hypothetical protein
MNRVFFTFILAYFFFSCIQISYAMNDHSEKGEKIETNIRQNRIIFDNRKENTNVPPPFVVNTFTDQMEIIQMEFSHMEIAQRKGTLIWFDNQWWLSSSNDPET